MKFQAVLQPGRVLCGNQSLLHEEQVVQQRRDHAPLPFRQQGFLGRRSGSGKTVHVAVEGPINGYPRFRYHAQN